jgi:anti-sigma regulatory factor (Ser/Thr protein kinase)
MTAMTAAQPRMKGHPGYRLTADRVPETAREARQLARVALSVWGLDGGSGTAALVMSELVANAVRHACGPKVRLAVNRPALDRVYLAVTDRSPLRLPQLRAPDDDEAHGRGLLLIDDLADRWGYDLLGPVRARSAKRVWVELKVLRD